MLQHPEDARAGRVALGGQEAHLEEEGPREGCVVVDLDDCGWASGQQTAVAPQIAQGGEPLPKEGDSRLELRPVLLEGEVRALEGLVG